MIISQLELGQPVVRHGLPCLISCINISFSFLIIQGYPDDDDDDDDVEDDDDDDDEDYDDDGNDLGNADLFC
jgi:hypothetical protein